MTKLLRSPSRAVFSPAARHDIEAAHAAAAPGVEACGALLGVQRAKYLDVRRALPWSGGGPAGGFSIPPEDLLRMRQQTGADESLLGFWHTHPSGVGAPSSRDLREHQAFLHAVPGRVRPERALLIVPGPAATWSLWWWYDAEGWRVLGLDLPADA